MAKDEMVSEWLRSLGLHSRSEGAFERWLRDHERLPVVPRLTMAVHVDVNDDKCLNADAWGDTISPYHRESRSVRRHLRLVDFPHRDAGHLVGGRMTIQLALRRDCQAGWWVANWMLERQERIPTAWQKYLLVFPGTLLSDVNGLSIDYPHVVTMDHDLGYWALATRDLSYELPERARFVRVKHR